ncbi:FimD/PapC C-terminal domain-containing protein [Pantoea endophytica]
MTLDDGTHPPFGASVRNRQGRELGIISDNGAVWLSGLNTRDQPAVHWNEERQCLLSEVDIASQDTTTIRCLSMDKNYEG